MMSRTIGSTAAMVCDVLALLAGQGVQCDLFGGWAEELLGLRDPGPHADIDLVYRGDDFAAIDDTICRLSLHEIPEKRFSHKRAIVHRGILCEFLLVRDWNHAPVTVFWGDVTFRWCVPLLQDGTITLNDQPVSLVSDVNLAHYRAQWRSTQPHRWRDPASLLGE
ncbi:hypothetical protein [Reyranella sp. CPCC 100927]|uniref:hypothetical protein n=1 Tax=Reyranella sp. CPCC 100927 TaxID=2599616 RepID=UPI0021079AB2|nr:hypothetical protein [Reyranella sp. CPCC 100927]